MVLLDSAVCGAAAQNQAAQGRDSGDNPAWHLERTHGGDKQQGQVGGSDGLRLSECGQSDLNNIPPLRRSPHRPPRSLAPC